MSGQKNYMDIYFKSQISWFSSVQYGINVLRKAHMWPILTKSVLTHSQLTVL